MSAKSFLTARLMECWAHGQDVVDAAVEAGVAARREPTDRLRHIAQLGVITRGWSYVNRGMEVPPARSGSSWPRPPAPRGPGARTTPPTAVRAARPWTSASWSRSAATRTTPTSWSPASWPPTGSSTPKPSPAPPPMAPWPPTHR